MVHGKQTSLKPTKTNFMFFGTHNKTNNVNENFKLLLNGKVINHVDALKFLGVTVDQNLTWNQHINNLSKNVPVVLEFYIKSKISP